MAETYSPNPPPNAAIRSQQTAEAGSATPSASGVPGALSNQPPVPAIAPITTPPLTGAANTANPPGAASNANSSRNATTNYELDKTVKHTRSASGLIKRLSVAVVINQKKSTPDKEGKTKSLPLSPDEIEQVQNLVREAMGYNKERGDTLNVANVSFNAGEREVIAETPLWKSPEFIAMARESVKYLAVLIAAMLLWNKLIKPLFAAWMGAAEERRRALNG